MADVPKELFDYALKSQLNNIRYSNSVARDIIALLNDADKEILAKLEKWGDSGRFTPSHLKALLKEIRQMVSESYAGAHEQIRGDMAAFADHVAVDTASMIATQAPIAYNVVRATSEQLAAIVDTTPVTVGPDKKLLLEEVFSSLANGKEEAIRGAIRLGMVEGESTQELVRRLRGTRDAQFKDGVLNTSRRHAEAMCRTICNSTGNQAMQAVYKANEAVVKSWIFLATLDSRVSVTCASLSGTKWAIGEGPIPPRHPNCLPGDSLVTPIGRITAVSKRWYDGNVVIIKTASGKTFTATPNHPILTPSGWVAVGSLNVGSDVISYGGVKATSPNVNGDHKQIPSRIEDVAESFLSHSEVLSVPVPSSPEHFHGDGAGSEVAIIGANRKLWLSRDTSFCEHVHKLPLVFRNGFASGVRPVYQRLGGYLCAPDRIMSSFRKGLSLFGCCTSHASKLLLASVTCFNSLFAEKFSQIGCRAVAKPFRYPAYPYTRVEQLNSSSKINHRSDITSGAERATNGLNTRPNRFVVDSVLNSQFSSGGTCDIFSGKDLGRGKSGRFPHHDASSLQPGKDSDITDIELACKILGGASGEVFPDEIVGIEIRSFSGHVYNLQTESNWYVAQGIVSHNCRSIAIPEMKTFRELGLDIDDMPPSVRASKNGPVDSSITMDAWMRTQSREEIVDMLGPTRAKLFLDGKLDIQKFATSKGEVYTLDQLKKKNAAAFNKAFG